MSARFPARLAVALVFATGLGACAYTQVPPRSDDVFLDCNRIKIGNNVFLGPQVQLYTAHHPLLAAERIKGPELASPIHIGDNVWIGGGSIICAGVAIGENTTIGAGSVVVKDIPPNVLAVGNPCMAIRNL